MNIAAPQAQGLNIAVPIYVVESFTGTFGPDGQPIMRIVGAVPVMALAGMLAVQEKLTAYTITMRLQIHSDGMPLPREPGSDTILSPK